MAFLDEQEQEIVAPEEPERPRRRVGGPERRRQQILLRRLIAVGVGIGFVILLVIGFRGCLEARSDRGLRNYAQDVSTVMAESEQRGKDFFELVDSPGGTTELQFQQQVRSLRGASQSLLDRAESTQTPDQMQDAQSAVTLSLRLRRDALGTIADNVTVATADAQTSDAIETITEQMGSLYASDILWSQVGSPEINAVLQSEQVETQDLPAGNFMPETNPTDYLDQTTVVEKLAGITGADASSGSHGLGLISTAIDDISLTADGTTEVADDASEISIEVQNQGEVDESGITVTVTLNGTDLTKTIEELAAGDSTEVTLPISSLPQPGSEATVEVVVEPVQGEQVTDNNTASYTVVFGSSSGTIP